MSASEGSAAPASGSFDDIRTQAFQESSRPPGALEPAPPTLEELAADPEIAALLHFEAVPRKIAVEGGWSLEAQREFIARLAVHGSPGKACSEMGKDRGGARNLYNSPEGASFRAAWHAAVELAARRKAGGIAAQPGLPVAAKPPTIDHRWKTSPRPSPEGERGAASAAEGQALNEFGEWEDEGSLRRRDEDARDNMARKLLNARRLYLHEISQSPGKRAAFEILTDHAVDWEKAQALEPQPDEPWTRPNMREHDMLLTAENGWLGDMARGRDKLAELRAAVDEYRAAEGLPAVDWSDDE